MLSKRVESHAETVTARLGCEHHQILSTAVPEVVTTRDGEEGWWFLILLAPALWATWDYLRQGDISGAVEGFGRQGTFFTNFFKDENTRH